jgi:hypothetical protein
MSLLGGASLQVVLNPFDAVAVSGRLLRNKGTADTVIFD